MLMKTKLVLLLTLMTITSIGFSQQTINGSFMHNGIQRNYILYVPASYTPGNAVPLLFNFHGYTSTANQQMFYGDFRPIADTANFIIVHPQGTQDINGNTHFNVGWGGSAVNDVAFTDALIDTISSQYDINADRIYTTGMSNGGFMSFRLACELSNRFAAIGSVTGSILPTTLGSCNPDHPMPIIQIHGDSDGTVPYNGSPGFSESIPSLIDWWINENNCSTTPILTNMPNTNTSDGTTVVRSRYTDGTNCSEVVHFKVVNGDHTWPGAPINFPGTNYDINASLEIWNFLAQFDINGKIGCATNSITENEVTEKELVKIVDLLGRETKVIPGVPLIYMYSDGTTRKVIRTE